jgi:hypothetical protein
MPFRVSHYWQATELTVKDIKKTYVELSREKFIHVLV